jgi:hypothetical protein
MRRISRIDRSIALLWARTIAPTPSPHLCSACMHQGASYSTSLIRPAPANTKAPFTEKIRQRIWGTDQPPGQEDPYGDASVFDRTKRGLEKTEVEEPETPEALETAEATATEVSADYEPAHTWDGLEEVGGFSEYWDSDNQFRGFLPAEITTDTAEVTAALHRAMVEVFALQRAGKQLVEVSSTVPGEDLTYEVKLSPSATGATLQFSDNSSLAQVVQSLAPAVDETKEKGAPTQSEEDVVADRSTEDPQAGNTSDLAYADIVASWDPSWLQISLENPEVKFAVSAHLMYFENRY